MARSATTLNTIVLATVATLLLGAGRHDSFLARFAYTHTASRMLSQANALADPIEFDPIGTPDNPLRLEARKKARFPLSFASRSAVPESYFLVLSGLPPSTTLVGATRIGKDSWLLAANASSQLQIIMADKFATVWCAAAARERCRGRDGHRHVLGSMRRQRMRPPVPTSSL